MGSMLISAPPKYKILLTSQRSKRCPTDKVDVSRMLAGWHRMPPSHFISHWTGQHGNHIDSTKIPPVDHVVYGWCVAGLMLVYGNDDDDDDDDDDEQEEEEEEGKESDSFFNVLNS